MKRDRRRKRAYKNMQGFSLIELTISMVILTVILGFVSMMIGGVTRDYAKQRPRTEAINSASAAMDTMLRLIRMAGNNPDVSTCSPTKISDNDLQAIDPGTADASGIYRTIHIQSNWNPVDCNTTGAFEDVKFSVVNGVLMVAEGVGSAPVKFLDNIGDLQFTYFDSNNDPINPSTNNAAIRRIEIQLQTQSPNLPAMTFTSSAQLRTRSQ